MMGANRDLGSLASKVKELLVGHICQVHQSFLTIHEGASLKLRVTDLRNSMRAARAAFGMGLHPRLGERSPLLLLGSRLVRRILNTYWDAFGQDPTRSGSIAETTSLSFSPQLYSPVPAPAPSLGGLDPARNASPPALRPERPLRAGRPAADDTDPFGSPAAPASAHRAARSIPRDQVRPRRHPEHGGRRGGGGFKERGGSRERERDMLRGSRGKHRGSVTRNSSLRSRAEPAERARHLSIY